MTEPWPPMHEVAASLGFGAADPEPSGSDKAKARWEVVATKLYGADGERLMPAAVGKLERWQAQGDGTLPVCMAKLPNSLFDDPKRRGRPRSCTVIILDAKLAAGAGFVVADAGHVPTRPGLPKSPGAESIDIDADGNVVGLV